MTEELKKQAQKKLADARTLINEAGQLAKEGQFVLHFGEVGVFIPSSLDDPKKMREQATQNVKLLGRFNGSVWVSRDAPYKGSYVENLRTPWDDMDEVEREEAIDDEIERLKDAAQDDAGVSGDDFEYSSRDEWWHPSRC